MQSIRQWRTITITESRRPWVSVVEMPSYVAAADKLMSLGEQMALIEMLARNPEAGVVMPGTGGVRKVRVLAAHG